MKFVFVSIFHFIYLFISFISFYQIIYQIIKQFKSIIQIIYQIIKQFNNKFRKQNANQAKKYENTQICQV